MVPWLLSIPTEGKGSRLFPHAPQAMPSQYAIRPDSRRGRVGVVTPEERARDFTDRVLWHMQPLLRDNARIEIQGMMVEAIREEREACARVVEETSWNQYAKGNVNAQLAAAIRARNTDGGRDKP